MWLTLCLHHYYIITVFLSCSWEDCWHDGCFNRTLDNQLFVFLCHLMCCDCMLQEKSQLVLFRTIALYSGSLPHKEIGSEPGNTVVSCSAIHTRCVPSLVLSHPHPSPTRWVVWMAEHETRNTVHTLTLLFSAILPTYYHSVPFRLLKQNVTKTMWNSWNKLILKEKGIVQNRNKK